MKVYSISCFYEGHRINFLGLCDKSSSFELNALGSVVGLNISTTFIINIDFGLSVILVFS